MPVDLSKVVEKRSITLLPTRQDRAERKRKAASQDNAGPAWFNMPAADRTPEMEKDLRLLSMRTALDPKQHYRRGERPGRGKYFQVGTVVADSTGFYADRLTKRQRGGTMLDTLMRDTERQQYFKKKYDVLQEASLKASRKPKGQWQGGKK